MKVKVTAEKDRKKLIENLNGRFKNAVDNGDGITVELESPENLERVPGIKSFSFKGEKHEGLHGRPIQDEAYARLESRRDAVKALLATIEGYDLFVFQTDRKWDLKQLRRYNPRIKHLKFDSPKDVLGVEKTLQEDRGLETVEIDIDDDEVEMLYREMLT